MTFDALRRWLRVYFRPRPTQQRAGDPYRTPQRPRSRSKPRGIWEAGPIPPLPWPPPPPPSRPPQPPRRPPGVPVKAPHRPPPTGPSPFTFRRETPTAKIIIETTNEEALARVLAAIEGCGIKWDRIFDDAPPIPQPKPGIVRS